MRRLAVGRGRGRNQRTFPSPRPGPVFAPDSLAIDPNSLCEYVLDCLRVRDQEARLDFTDAASQVPGRSGPRSSSSAVFNCSLPQLYVFCIKGTSSYFCTEVYKGTSRTDPHNLVFTRQRVSEVPSMRQQAILYGGWRISLTPPRLSVVSCLWETNCDIKRDKPA
ncbi:hypothetical protein EVAR_74406_1 [Eumeta japonica]|uniref:Uncharacterized protein n=1 Tax=Eumeta variegata TaxID=151549 RepID=A0A4C1SE21_EUMVA|nr:hypothetical protein EVAR_74406_1 [Eumeta japonica]